MNFVTAWVIVGSVALAGGDLKKDKAGLQGTWKVTASVSKGEKSSAEDIKDLFLIFKGHAILIREGGKAEERFAYSLNPLKTTKEIDLTLKIGPQKGRVDRGIYKIDGDKLTICIQTNKDSPRPRDFRSPIGSELWLVTLERTKE